MNICAICSGTEFRKLAREDTIPKRAALRGAKNNHVWLECVGCGSEYRENIVHPEKETTP